MSGLGPCGKRLRAEAALLEHRSDGVGALRPDSCAAGGAAPRCERVARSRLSFGDELDEEQDGPGIAASTAKRRALGPSCSATPLVLAVRPSSPELATARVSRFLVERKLAASAVHGQPRASPFAEPAPGAPRAAPQASLGRLCYGVAQARGARAYMEDKHTIVSSFQPLGGAGAVDDGVQRSYFGVFDGHNGQRSAEEASTRLHAVLARDAAFHQCRGEPGASPSAVEAESAAMSGAITRAFSVVDGEILDRARAEDGRDGSTGLVVVRAGGVLWAAHAGDSRAVLARGARAVRLTEDHKPCLPAERLRVEANGGRVQLGRGQRCWFVECEPDVLRLCLQPDDRLVILATDGLWDVLEDQTAVDVALATLRASAAAPGCGGRVTDAQAKLVANALVMEALQRNTLDNITVIALLLQWD